AYHAPCHLRVQEIGFKARDVLLLVPGTTVDVLERCTGMDGTWGFKREFYDASLAVARPLLRDLEAVRPDVVVSDCPLAALPIALEDILGGERYASRRDAIRRRVIAHKQARRVAVGDRMTFLFEDRATVWYQVQEMLWVERITDLERMREELAVYNELLPGP